MLCVDCRNCIYDVVHNIHVVDNVVGDIVNNVVVCGDDVVNVDIVVSVRVVVDSVVVMCDCVCD